MRLILIALLATFLIFGCTGGNQQQTTGPDIKNIVPVGDVLCQPEYTFSEMADGVFGKTTELKGTASCASGDALELTVDGTKIAAATLGEGQKDVVFKVPGLKTGMLTIALTSKGQTIYSTNWNVKPLGNDDISGAEYDQVSFKEWKAMAFDFDAPAKLNKASLYMKLLEGRTQPGTNMLLDLRKDENGEPGELVDSVTLPITKATMSYNWIDFAFDSTPQVSKGRYWIVLSIEQTENVKVVSDSLMIHYTTADKTQPGNDYTKRMTLSVDAKTGVASATQWTGLSYDRQYNILLR